LPHIGVTHCPHQGGQPCTLVAERPYATGVRPYD